MAKPQLWLMGEDLIARGLVNKIPDAIERKTFQRDSLISNSFNIECNNTSNLFSVGNSKSIFNGANWLYTPIKYISEDSITTWDGLLINPKCNHNTKKCVLETKDALFQIREKYIEYKSSSWETGATAALNLMIQEGFTTYDNNAIQSSINYLTTLNAYIKVNINMSDSVTLFQALEKLALFTGADCYSHLNDVYFEVWQPLGTAGVSIEINTTRDNRPKTKPIVTYLEKDIINDYSIDYAGSGGVALTDINAGNIGSVSRQRFGSRVLSPFDTGTGKQIVFKDSVTAQAIGELYIKRATGNLSTNPQPLKKIQFDIKYKFRQYVALGVKFKYTLSDEDWTKKVFEIYEFKFNRDRQNINIVAIEVL